MAPIKRINGLVGAGVTKRRPLRRGGFTLVELLIVVVIMAIMIGVALPRFEDIGRGSKMRAATTELRSTLALARQWAIANREDVYVVVPDDKTALYSGLSTNEYPKALRSYAVYSRSKGYIKDWTYLPGGVYFLDQYNSEQGNRPALPICIADNKNVLRQTMLYYNPDNGIPFPATNNNTKTINALRFTPRGQAAGPGGVGVVDFDFYLVEAVALDGSAGRVVNLMWKNNPVVWTVRVAPLTGMMRLIDCAQL